MTTDSKADTAAASDAHDVDAAPVTDRTHDNSWSANLEGPEHAADRSLVVDQAVSAIEHTAPGNHVNLVTHGDHGHPETYLYGALDDAYGDDIDWEYVDQCGCGGHVVRVDV
ncbi:CGCGG family putative rSAM-modified RiPP protein [Halobellus captivus]|uniref:CGCGG family putative rSAM-modified RiPP protein n=1 Tax=Halobellus captivus TaxID=2592614 RepID=UPI00119D4522|nr:CGCGG family rSAM-modified RiPP protein [Halobellus captivus]